jgi:hypothetical protein
VKKKGAYLAVISRKPFISMHPRQSSVNVNVFCYSRRRGRYNLYQELLYTAALTLCHRSGTVYYYLKGAYFSSLCSISFA